MNYLQQGDVLLFVENEIPNTLVSMNTNVVQEGEHTGHAHRLDTGEVFIEPKTKVKYLKLVNPTMLRHEEHKAFNVPAGLYRVGIVREVDPFEDEIRAVKD